jgi:hypothetical protein
VTTPTEIRPAILLDVDGVLNPDRWQLGFRGHHAVVDGEAYTVRLNPEHGEWLKGLAEDCNAELMWATFWNEHANTHIGPRLGLPRLPVVEIDETILEIPGSLSDREAEWKSACVASWVDVRPIVWFDDAEGLEEKVLLQPQIGRHLIVPVDGRRGLTWAHVETARKWLLEVAVT